LEDHVHLAKKDKPVTSSQKDKSEKQDLEKSLKTNLFVQDMSELRFCFASNPKGKMTNYSVSFFDCSLPSPPTPPPDMV
jgi:hypothetical protein